MTGIPGLSPLLNSAGKHVEEWHEGAGHLRVVATSSVRSAICPRCAQSSSRTHGCYRREFADQPCFGQRVLIGVEVRRFKCVNPSCSQRTFAEHPDPLAAPRQRRTRRMNEALCSLGYALGGSAAARLAARLGMTVSGATILRALRRAGCPAPASPPVVVGIDDWAIKRGHRYGTVIVDLVTRQPIEVLGRREATIVADWLGQHPTVEIVARDRAGAYSDAARTAIPRAQQVADRWHLLTNLRDSVERLLVRHSARVREAASVLGEALRIEAQPLTSDSTPTALPLNAWQRLGVHRRAARLAQYDEVVRRRNLGESFKAIGGAMNLDHRTVRRFVQAGTFPERATRTSGTTLLDGHRQYLASRVAQGCVKPALVWRELQARDFAGSLGTVRGAMARAHAAASQAGALRRTGCSIACPSSSRAYAWLVGWNAPSKTEPKTAEQRRLIEILCRIEPEIAAAGSLARNFLGLIHRRDVSGFDKWLDKASQCTAPELKRFAASLKADLSAVRAAFTSPWSSGQVEGQVNRLKYLKRQMYGRAKLDLLRIRVLHSN